MQKLSEIENGINKRNILYVREYLKEALPEGKFIIRFNVLDNKISILPVEHFSHVMTDDLAVLFIENGKIVNERLYEHYYPNDYKELAGLNDLLVSFFKAIMFSEDVNITEFLKDYKDGEYLVKLLRMLELDELCEHLLYDSLYEDPFARIELQNYVVTIDGKIVVGDDRYCYSNDYYDFTLTSKAISAAVGYLNAKIYCIYDIMRGYTEIFKSTNANW